MSQSPGTSVFRRLFALHQERPLSPSRRLWHSLLDGLFSGNENRQRPIRSRALQLEILEDRTVPSLLPVAGLTTLAAQTTGVIGTSVLSDTATLTGGNAPTGTISFSIQAPDGTVTPEGSVAVSGDNTYSGPGTVLAMEAGTYLWTATYSGDTNNQSAGPSNQYLTVAKASPSVGTAVNDGTGVITTGPLGDQVYATASLSGTVSGLTPTGTVTYCFYNTATPTYGTTTPVSTQQVTLNTDGSVPSSSDTAALKAGSYSFVAVYSGDGNYAGYIGSVKPLTIDQAGSKVSSNIVDAGGGAVTGKVGEEVYDTAAVSGSPFTPTGTVTYDFYATATPVYGTTTPAGTHQVTLNANGTVPSSSDTAALTAGSYSYIAVYSGDSNYTGSVGGVEPLIIAATGSLASPTVTTTASFKKGGICPCCCGNQGGGSNVVGIAIPEDTAVLAGGKTPTGTITFTLTDPNGQVADTLTVTVKGNGTYLTTNTVVATLVGTYTWSAHYSGDTKNNPATDNGVHEQDPVIKASPTLSAVASCKGPFTLCCCSGGGGSHGNTVGSAVPEDTAVLANGYKETGTITFTLTGPSGTVLDTETDTVNGNGTYSTTYAATATVGNYIWTAVYGGDVNNNSATQKNTGAQKLAFVKASPTLSTTASFKSGTTGTGGTAVVGTAVPESSAVLAGGYDETGTITFTLKDPKGKVVYTQVVTVNGNGSYATTSTIAATLAGTYKWSAVYSGDSLNNSAQSQGGKPAQLSVVAATGKIQGTVSKDNNGKGFASDSKFSAPVVVCLSQNGKVVATTTTDSNGNFSFSNCVTGAYTVSEQTPKGWTQTAALDTSITVSAGQDSTCDFANFLAKSSQK